MQVNSLVQVFCVVLMTSSALAQDFSEGFTSKEDIREHIEALDILEDQFQSAISTEDGHYLLDMNDFSLGGVMAYFVFARKLFLDEDGQYVERQGRTPRMLSGLEDLAKELGSVEVRINFDVRPDGRLTEKSYLNFYTSRGHLTIGSGSPMGLDVRVRDFPTNIAVTEIPSDIEVRVQSYPPIRQIPLEALFKTDFKNSIEVLHVLGDPTIAHGKYAPQMHKLKIWFMRTVPREYDAFLGTVVHHLDEDPKLLRQILLDLYEAHDDYRRQSPAAVSSEIVDRLNKSGNLDLPPNLATQLEVEITRFTEIEGSPTQRHRNVYRPLSQRAFHQIRTLLQEARLHGIGGAFIGLGFVAAAIALPADTVHANALEENHIPIYWTLTTEQIETHLKNIQSEKAFWSEVLGPKDSAVSIFGL